ncbi:hypothetical protein ABZZ47_26525 [Streptomyces sp. NPDC006465]|uniref:hypothetical protein n=1 Tax=Streptomyces sp. NPDC006465 TaxID=3157174 RepID=UPI0033B8CA2C
MPRNWSRGADRIPPDPIDGDYDRLKKIVKAHQLHDSDRPAKATRAGRSSNEASSRNANTPQKHGWWRR